MLSDEHRREVQYALEYATLARLNKLPPPVPPPCTWSQINQKFIDLRNGTVHPIPVPCDWAPQHTVGAHTCSQLKERLSKLQDVIVKTLHTRLRMGLGDNGYFLRAYSYLVTADKYLISAIAEESRAHDQRVRAESVQRLAEKMKVYAEESRVEIERFRALAEKWSAEKHEDAAINAGNPV